MTTIKIVVLGLIAFAFGTAAGVIFGKIMCKVTGGKVNPLIGSAGVGFAEVYSQKKATGLDHLEKIVLVDILGLVLIIATELIKVVRFAAQNKILQKKVYLDEATGLPNKNKCEESEPEFRSWMRVKIHMNGRSWMRIQ